MLEININNNRIENPNANKKYQLHFDNKTMEKIKTFCETFYVEPNNFIVRAVGWYLFIIEDDIANHEYDQFTSYFNLSDIIGTSDKVPQKKQEKKIIVEAEFHPLISDAIDKICEIVHWTPEEFIEYRVKCEIDDVILKLKKEDYRFLDKYINFSEITEPISKIYKENLL